MYLITGAAGFIASALVSHLNAAGVEDLILVDDFQQYPAKKPNLAGKKFHSKVERDELFARWDAEQWPLEGVYHLGARTDTTEPDRAIFDRLNLNYSKEIWNRCTTHEIPLIYASSGATYGLGEHGYKDEDELAEILVPLNEYGRSKNEFDRWVLGRLETPPHYYGLKFFNVYGPNENHKGRMASVIWHTFNQVQKTGAMKLFRSHNPDYANGHQRRDFIYVKDLVAVNYWLMENLPEPSGLYNLGTGESRTFLDLAKATFAAMDVEPDISFIDTPEDIRDKYQYFTEAEMGKLRAAGYDRPFFSLEEGVEDYVKSYLIPGLRW
ncbi:ADP-glyceromanno-heptose 6-epimerase [Neolewinella aurantiaca]|uniref:ADP-L-glycero-D-manno-heptose-6-epimerase n=1 Tax=Neolewinella aurantiaca TaxID=2602767 RepID=A0A5C7FX83_9BACT|nr:ADP-glyceromanno-heptose 6-epimerase [Neolewinella aurantiaca]TXF91358.1 ADP-glyceromanno-heptose 6-epimerase [Neolewinella aurantiaca]